MKIITVLVCAALLACSASPPSTTPSRTAGASSAAPGAIARVYFWRAKPGKLAEYNRYVRDIAAPIDEEARRRGAVGRVQPRPDATRPEFSGDCPEASVLAPCRLAVGVLG